MTTDELNKIMAAEKSNGLTPVYLNTPKKRIGLEASDLRVGNIVYNQKSNGWSEKGIIIIESISKTGVNRWQDMGASGEASFDELKGVPLIPEILSTNGFKFKRCGISGADEWQGMDFWTHDNLRLRGNVSTASGGMLHLEGYFNSRIMYVHQLQNVFYAIMQTEMEINKL